MKKVKKFWLFFFLIALFELTSFYPAQAEIIDVQNEEKNFGDWKVFCETDAMMDISHCKIASKFYENVASLTVEPTTKFLGQLFMVIPQIKIGSFVKIRVDKNDLILSKNIGPKDFGLIPLDSEQKTILYHQMKNGDSLFLRFNANNSEKEITVKISLKDFRSALSYFNSRASK